MALVFADNTGGGWQDSPPVKVGSNVGYGKYRVFYDTIDFSANNAVVGDDVVIGSLTEGATVWGNFKLWSVATGMTATSTAQLGVVGKDSGTFTPLAAAADLTTADTPVGFTAADAVAAGALPASAGEESWLVLRIAGADAVAGVIKAEVPVTVE